MIFVIIAIIVLVVWIIAVYNGLVKRRMRVRNLGVKLMCNSNVVMTSFRI